MVEEGRTRKKTEYDEGVPMEFDCVATGFFFILFNSPLFFYRTHTYTHTLQSKRISPVFKINKQKPISSITPRPFVSNPRQINARCTAPAQSRYHTHTHTLHSHKATRTPGEKKKEKETTKLYFSRGVREKTHTPGFPGRENIIQSRCLFLYRHVDITK